MEPTDKRGPESGLPDDGDAGGGEESCRIGVVPVEAEGGINSPADLDRLDWLALGGLVVLLLSAAMLVVMQPGEEGRKAGKGALSRQAVLIVNPELDRKMAVASALLNGGDPGKAAALLDTLISEFPYEGGPHMLKGDLFLRKQQPVEAMLEYRQGVDLNPDYLDKKMKEVFQGKKIKGTLEEARLVISAGLAENKDDQDLREHRKVLYYMLRKVAGSCG